MGGSGTSSETWRRPPCDIHDVGETMLWVEQPEMSDIDTIPQLEDAVIDA